ncbi:MAG: class I SAM-dependent methyltransferase [Bacteroidota bacterium]
MMQAVHIAHMFLKECLKEGDIVIDATSGNGHDTLFFSLCIGSKGKVIAIDIQEEAIISTQHLMKQHDRSNVEYHLMNHKDLSNQFEEYTGNIACISFNLGYLPGALDHSITTQSQTTIQALDACSTLLQEDGCISVIAYRGHPHGLEEAQAVETWMRGLSAREWHTIMVEAINQHSTSPLVFFAQKKHQSSIA